MSTDPWGVDSGYRDARKKWQATPPDTHRAILAAMGVEDANAVPPPEERVRFIPAETEIDWDQPGEVQLEDGGRLPVADRIARLPLGYHEFHPRRGSGPVRLIAAPEKCSLPPPMWGWSAQLYAARSKESWGIGDLGDLRRLARWSAELGAASLLINPLSATAPVVPQEASPYFAGSRRFFNPLYLRVEEVPGAARLGSELEKLSAAGRALNADRRIDRDAVFRLKDDALRAIWAGCSDDRDFEQFRRDRGAELEQFAIWSALAARFGGDWRTWPSDYHRPESPAVRAFARESDREVGYHQWLQWLLDVQLARAAGSLALVQDLPIGVDPGGADAWVWQDLLAVDCSVGAPPDVFNPAGQDWNLPPLVPHKLRAAGYGPFIETIRAALRHAGGLRIDHVMGLFRLYWIPQGFGPQRGAYVRYPADDLLRIVALESCRRGAFVVGEDLGTVEPKVRRELKKRRMLSFRVLWFEDHPPAEYPELAMAAATTHDLPTVAGLWTRRDMAEQEEVGAGDPKEFERTREKFAELSGLSEEAAPAEAIETVYTLLGQAPSRVLIATLEDAAAVEERPNMPGTIWQQRINWSSALPGGLEALEAAELPRRIARALSRPHAAGRKRADDAAGGQ